MDQIPTSQASQPPYLPKPVQALEDALRQGLIERPGRASLEAVFGPAQTIQLELAVDALVEPLQRYRTASDAGLRALRRAAGRATFSLRRATDQLGTGPAPLAPAEAAVAEAVTDADALGPTGVNIGALMRHIDLHLRIARLWEGETNAHALFNALGDGPAAVREGLDDWRCWSDARFGDFECIDTLADGSCRQLGYRFAGQLHPVHYAGERRTHQGLVWRQLRAHELGTASRALASWQRLREILTSAE